MRRVFPAVLVLCVGALAGADEKEPGVNTIHDLDAPALAKGEREGVALEKRQLVLEGKTSSGKVETGELKAARAFDRVLASINAETPEGSSVEVLVRLRLEDGAWTDWLSFGRVARPGEKLPRSVPCPDGAAKVAIDVIELAGKKARSLEARVVLERGKESPRVRRLHLVAWPRKVLEDDRGRHASWGKTLDVEERSQRVEDPKIAGRICSPTSLSMVLAFHGMKKPTAEVCHEVLDRQTNIYGNWALNVAYAGRLGFDAAVVRMASFRPLEEEIAAGRPVVITHHWKKGELTGAPIDSSDGHLIVVKGLTAEGDLVVNDPAADPRKDQKISRVYKRQEIRKTWLEGADGIAYVVAKAR